jgi:hypothetical protein
MLDELSLYNRALTAAEVTRIHDADHAGKCLGLATAAQAVENLRAAVIAQAPNPTPLVASLSTALESIERQNLHAARHQLQSFLQKVRAQVAPDDPALAQQLVDQAQAILDSFPPNSPKGDEP